MFHDPLGGTKIFWRLRIMINTDSNLTLRIWWGFRHERKMCRLAHVQSSTEFTVLSGTFANLRKATNQLSHVCLSVEQLWCSYPLKSPNDIFYSWGDSANWRTREVQRREKRGVTVNWIRLNNNIIIIIIVIIIIILSLACQLHHFVSCVWWFWILT